MVATFALTLYTTASCSLFRVAGYDDLQFPILSAVRVAVASKAGDAYALNAKTGCVTGISTSVDSNLPAWIRDHFKCANISVSGSNYVFASRNLPNHPSAYYAEDSALYAEFPTGHAAAIDRRIASQNFVYAIPMNPTPNTGTLVGTQGGLSSIGITTNGLAIFNNAAAPGHVLAEEERTFDSYNGHPESSGTYHHHTEPLSLTHGDAQLVGLALDGYPIYGLLCDQGTAKTLDDLPPGQGTPKLDAHHGHFARTIHFPRGRYHYHYAFDATATIRTLMGSFFYGNIGSVTK